MKRIGFIEALLRAMLLGLICLVIQYFRPVSEKWDYFAMGMVWATFWALWGKYRCTAI